MVLLCKLAAFPDVRCQVLKGGAQSVLSQLSLEQGVEVFLVVSLLQKGVHHFYAVDLLVDKQLGLLGRELVFLN